MEQQTLFGGDDSRPLAARLRPRDLSEFVGQSHLLGEGKVLRRLIESDRVQLHDLLGTARCGQNHAGHASSQNAPKQHLSTFPLSPAASKKSGR